MSQAINAADAKRDDGEGDGETGAPYQPEEFTDLPFEIGDTEAPVGVDEIRVPLRDTKDAAEIALKEEAEVRERLVETHLEKYLRRNAETVDVLGEMVEVTDEFARYFPFTVVSKCIDGRCHGTRSKGIPPACKNVSLMRAEGNKADVGLTNGRFWMRIINAEKRADRSTTSRMPAVFMAFGHTSRKAHACAAHEKNPDGTKRALDETDEAALLAAKAQADAVASSEEGKVYPIYGMTDTDDMSHTFYYPGGERIDVNELLETINLNSPGQVFGSEFLAKPIDDPVTKSFVGDGSVGKLFNNGRQFFQDLKVSVAMEAYLLREISRSINNDKNTVLNNKVFETIKTLLEGIDGFPRSLLGPMIYIIVYNMAHVLFNRARVTEMKEDRLKEYLGHSEEIICYGEGFQTLGRNEVFLVRSGSGNDMRDLETAKSVLAANKGKDQRHPPIVHVNFESHEKITSWGNYMEALTDLELKVRRIKEVFGDNVRILTTYSCASENQFYPINIEGNNGGAKSKNLVHMPNEVGNGLHAKTNAITIRLQEQAFLKGILDA